MRKSGLTIQIAIVAGVINCVAWYVFAKTIGFYEIDVYKYRNYVTLGVLITGIFLAVFLAKRKANGFIEFKDTVKTGLLYSIVLAVVLAIFNYIYYAFITPDTIEFFLSEAKNYMLKYPEKFKAEDIPRYLEGEKGNFSSVKLIPPVLFFGLLVSLLIGAILQKKDPNKVSEN
jgi:hypothetical protein